MLPYTIYHIPETENNKTENKPKWLWMIIRSPLKESDSDLLLKISSALKADFKEDVFCLLQPTGTSNGIATIGETKPKLIISFGVPATELGLWIDINRPGICVMESFTFIMTLPVEELANHALAKKELWISMQLFLE